jgi:hypothetical protein
MALQSVRVVKPLQRAVVAILNGYAPLQAVPPANRGDGTRPPRDNAHAPRDLYAWDVQHRRGRATPYAAETFAAWQPTVAGTPAAGLVRETHEWEIRAGTTHASADEAADFLEDIYSALLRAGYDLGLSVGGDRPVKGWDCNWRVEDVRAAAPGRPSEPGRGQKRIILTLRVNIELQAAQRQPAEVP